MSLREIIEDSKIQLVSYTDKILKFPMTGGVIYPTTSLFKWRSPPERYTLYVASKDMGYPVAMEIVYHAYTGIWKQFWEMTLEERKVLYETQNHQWKYRLK